MRRRLPPFLGPAAGAAALACIFAVANDWDESFRHRVKGSSLAATFIAVALFCAPVAFVLAIKVRQELLRGLADRPRPTPGEVMGRGVRLGIVWSFANVTGYLAFGSSSPFRVVTSFVVGGALAGAWLARSVVVAHREHVHVQVHEDEMRWLRAVDAGAAVVVVGLVAPLVAAFGATMHRMAIDDTGDRIAWAFAEVPFRGLETVASLWAPLACACVVVGGAVSSLAAAGPGSLRAPRRIVAALAGPPAFAIAGASAIYASALHPNLEDAVVRLRSAIYLSHVLLGWCFAMGVVATAVILAVTRRAYAPALAKPATESAYRGALYRSRSRGPTGA